MNAPVPIPTTAITIMGTHSGSPAGSTAITNSPAAPSDVPRMGKIRYRPVRLASHPVSRLLISMPNTVAMGTSPDTVAVVWYAIWKYVGK